MYSNSNELNRSPQLNQSHCQLANLI